MDLTDHRITVLLVDDHVFIGEAVRLMLASETDIVYHFCDDPRQAIETANRVAPTVIVQDLVMPDIDGLTMVRRFRQNPTTAETPIIVLSANEEPRTKAEAFALGANDYLVKLPDRIELIARLRHHSKGFISLLQRNEAYRALAASEKRLALEMAAATKYMRSLLPRPITTGRLGVDWRYVPCEELAGDAFGYHWLDAEHFALYLLDVTGHGLGSALLSVTVMDDLRSQTLPHTDFRQPKQVLEALNAAFPMESHDDKCFSIWYGVHDCSTGMLNWAGAGHPAAFLFRGTGGEAPEQLVSGGPIIGMTDRPRFDTGRTAVTAGDRLYVFSDGVYEIRWPGGEWTEDEFVAFMSWPAVAGESRMDRLLAHVRGLKGGHGLDDDFSMLEVRF